jgi:hypothetical protein
MFYDCLMLLNQFNKEIMDLGGKANAFIAFAKGIRSGPNGPVYNILIRYGV